jgi:hypothetical protein
MLGQAAGELEQERRMVSSTQQFERIRKRKMTTNGKRNKRTRRRLGTPVFPVHLEGYDASAPDAKSDAKKASHK